MSEILEFPKFNLNMPSKGEKNREVIKYNSTEDLINEKRETTFQLPFPWTGSGHVVYNNCLYYVTNVKNRIIRYDFGARRMKKQNEIVDALLGEECNYENNEHSEIELAVDETGLWVSQNFLKIMNHKLSLYWTMLILYGFNWLENDVIEIGKST